MYVCVHVCAYNYTVSFIKCKYRQLSNARITVGSILSLLTYTYDNSGHGNDNGKVNYVADNKMSQQMAFHGVVLLFTQIQIMTKLVAVTRKRVINKTFKTWWSCPVM